MTFDLRDFENQVLRRSAEVPVLVDFWAPWCGPCRVLGPILERMAGEANGRWELVKVNTEENEDLAATFEIASIPAVKLFVKGEVVDQFLGALPEREIRKFLEKALPSPHGPGVEEARRLLEAGDAARAAALLEPIVQGEPGNDEARTLLARAFLGASPERIEALLEPVKPDAEFADQASALRALARIAKLADQPDALPEAPVRSRYLEGATALRKLDFAGALGAFTEVLMRDKAYDQAGAKGACKAILQLLGMRHPISEKFFRAFSSALHA